MKLAVITFTLILLLVGSLSLADGQGITAPTITATRSVVGIAAPTNILTSTPSPLPTNTPRFSPTPQMVWADHFWLSRPFAYDPNGRIIDYPARGYAYGSTAGNSLQVHHGIDIENVRGTWIRAVASGTVFYAGDDLNVLFGPRNDFYGNLVVIEHDLAAADGSPVFSLYGHMDSIDVATGDVVNQNDVIGAVGATGVAFGSHLHLEVRLDNPYSYLSSVNPELWVQPWRDYGVLAARIIDADGNPVYGMRVELIGNGRYFTGWTYADDRVNGDPALGENFAIGDLPAGEYDLKVGEIRYVRYRDKVIVEPDTVTFIEITLP